MPSKKRKHEAEKSLREFDLPHMEKFIEFFEEPETYFDKTGKRGPKGIPWSEEQKAKIIRTIQEVGEVVKRFLEAYEDFYNSWDKHDSKTDSELQEKWHKLTLAVRRLESLPTSALRLRIGVYFDEFGEITVMTVPEEPDLQAVQRYGSELASYVCSKLNDLKYWVGTYRDQLPIGVCHLQTCRKLYIKDRKTQKYCSEPHRKLAWKRQQATQAPRKR